jgi:hypothetical protein
MAKIIEAQIINSCCDCPKGITGELTGMFYDCKNGVIGKSIPKWCPLKDAPQEEVEQFYKAVNQDCTTCLKAHDAEIQKGLELLAFKDKDTVTFNRKQLETFWEQQEGK